MAVGSRTLHDLVFAGADRHAEHLAVKDGNTAITYREFAREIGHLADGLRRLGIRRHDRVAVYLDKRVETVTAIFAAFATGAVAVPCNPVLKPHQLGHILRDSGARILVTSRGRLQGLANELDGAALTSVIVTDSDTEADELAGVPIAVWQTLRGLADSTSPPTPPVLETDMAAILYTSGSTGWPKGVLLSHRNMVVGAQSVAHYLNNGPGDRLLAVLPLSFDAGFSQLTTAFASGATAVLHNYLMPRDVPKVCAREGITGLTCVPPLWMQLRQVIWPDEARAAMRYIANTGGRMPREVLNQLRAIFPNAKPYLMYGLTEAFRSTYLDPAEVDRRPDSIGKAIPNAEIQVVRPDGQLAGPDEPGELVHRGPLVAMGYWNDPERTAERFKPAPDQPAGLPFPEIAVWSGDQVKYDADGFLYFIGRGDEMIKTSGYRVSPTEVEEVIFTSGRVAEAAAFGVPHATLGEAIVAAIVPRDHRDPSVRDDVMAHCRQALPRFMVPETVIVHAHLPRSANGKIDRKALAATYNENAVEPGA